MQEPSRQSQRGRKSESRDVRLSKSISYVLRHGAAKEKLPIRADGYLPVDVLLKRFHNNGTTFDDIKRIVESNDKNRFKLMSEAETGRWFIRANQGHSIEVAELDLKEITEATTYPIAVHGTYLNLWNSNIKAEGLSRMKRNHIHLAVGLPNSTDVISGMRKSAEVYIFIDLQRALTDGIKFYESENGVILTEGNNGILPTKYFSKVVDRNGISLL
ncbi:phosphotransferase KptA/Tpt1 [Dipodascopsis uninucleata]